MANRITTRVRTFSIKNAIDDLIRFIAEDKKWDLSTVVEEAINLYAMDQGYIESQPELQPCEESK